MRIQSSAILFFSTLLAVHGDVLRWQITDCENVDGSPDAYTYLRIEHLNNDDSMRLAAHRKNGDFVSYVLPAYGNLDCAFDLASADSKFDDEWTEIRRDDFSVGPMQAMCIGIHPYECLFQMHAGNCDESRNFISILFSGNLVVDSKCQYNLDDLSSYCRELCVSSFCMSHAILASNVPEPSSSLLCLIGFCVLMLRRDKRRFADAS